MGTFLAYVAYFSHLRQSADFLQAVIFPRRSRKRDAAPEVRWEEARASGVMPAKNPAGRSPRALMPEESLIPDP